MYLTNRDQGKLLEAGFTLIRGDELGLTIKCKTPDWREWHRLGGPYATKSGYTKMVQSYLKNDRIIEC